MSETAIDQLAGEYCDIDSTRPTVRPHDDEMIEMTWLCEIRPMVFHTKKRCYLQFFGYFMVFRK